MSNNALKVHFAHNTKAELWLPPNYGVKNLSNDIVIPAKSIVLATSGGLAYNGTLILDVRVPMARGFEKVHLHITPPSSGDICFFAEEETELGYRRFELDSLVSSFMKILL